MNERPRWVAGRLAMSDFDKRAIEPIALTVSTIFLVGQLVGRRLDSQQVLFF